MKFIYKSKAVVRSSAKEYLREATTELQFRFWKSVQGFGDACWMWQGTKNKSTGYGQISVSGHPHSTHRVAYTLAFGPIPEGMQVNHACDTRPCCNPSHLKLGTHDDNMHDKSLRNRAGGRRYWRDGIDG